MSESRRSSACVFDQQNASRWTSHATTCSRCVFQRQDRYPNGSSRLARFVLFYVVDIWGARSVDQFSNETADWLEARVGLDGQVELEIGALIAAASDWTEDETELDDLVTGLIETGSVELRIG